MLQQKVSPPFFGQHSTKGRFMKKSIFAAAIAFAAISTSTFASDLSVSGGISNVSMDDIDLSLNVVTAGLGSTYDINDSFSVMPEVRIGTGLGDDEMNWEGLTADVEIDRFLALSVRANYQVNDKVTLYVQPTYAELKVTASAMGAEASESGWEFGGGLGLNYAFSKQSSVDVQYERFSDTDVVGVAYRYSF
jgi:long-subunit fatty acid transport protein